MYSKGCWSLRRFRLVVSFQICNLLCELWLRVFVIPCKWKSLVTVFFLFKQINQRKSVQVIQCLKKCTNGYVGPKWKRGHRQNLLTKNHNYICQLLVAILKNAYDDVFPFLLIFTKNSFQQKLQKNIIIFVIMYTVFFYRFF